jgi:hypothetical protein
VYTSGNLQGLAIFAHSIINELAKSAVEVSMDTTFGTNNAATDLFAVLAEMDGTGVPLAYIFVGLLDDSTTGSKKQGGSSGASANSEIKTRRADPGALIHILDQFLRQLKAFDLNPVFFGIDKDSSEIAAVRQVWPEATIQLCYWHVKRAIRTKLKDSKKTSTQNHYMPAEAQTLVTDLEICWGSLPTLDPMAIIGTINALAHHAVSDSRRRVD